MKIINSSNIIYMAKIMANKITIILIIKTPYLHSNMTMNNW